LKDRNANRPGYKKTKVKSDNYSYRQEDIKLLRGDNVVHTYIRWDGVKRWSVTELDGLGRYVLHENDIVLAMDRTWVNSGLKCAVVRKKDLPCYLVQRVARIRGVPPEITGYWSFHLLSHRFEQYVKGNQTETAVPHISKKQIADFLIPIPSLPEQQEIAEILSTWDEAIKQMRKLIDAKKRRKKALMQQLLTGKKRLPGFGEASKNNSRFPLDWQSLRARDIFEVRSKKNHGNEPVLSVTQDEGVVHRDSLGRRIEASAANTNSYKLVEPGDFVISLRSFQGGLEFSKHRGIVSPAYHVIRPKMKIDDVFYRYYFKSHDFIGHLAIAVIGIRDGKQVSYNDFAFMYLPYPSTTEQKMIGTILSAADEEIEILQNKLVAIEKQKRGLMQKLLTGEVRVSV